MSRSGGQPEDWSEVVSFGARSAVANAVIRPSAYGLIADGSGRMAIVRTSEGTFLPGGGIEAGETPEEAIKRESLEECGLIVRLDDWAVRAVQFAYSKVNAAHFEKRSIFIGGGVEGTDPSRLEPDHELVWVRWETAAGALSHGSHRWAVERWRTGTRCV